MHSWSRCDGILIRCKSYIQSDNRKFRHALWWEGKYDTLRVRDYSVAKTMELVTALASSLCWLMYGTLVYRSKYLFRDWYFPRLPNQRPKRHLCRVQYCSFPPKDVTRTSGYCFEYDLHLIKIPSHLDRENMHWCFSVSFSFSPSPVELHSPSRLETFMSRLNRPLWNWRHSNDYRS